MNLLTLVIALLFGLTFIIQPRNGGGWFWDSGNAIGFLALAGLLFQMVPPSRRRTGREHEVLGYWVLATAIVHAFWFLVGDGVVRFYLLPRGPVHMWFGLFALLAMAVLVVLARMPDRMRVHRRFRIFRQMHRGLAGFTVAAALLHVVLSGFYLPAWPQVVLLILLASAACLGAPARFRPDDGAAGSVRSVTAAGVLAVTGFVVMRNLGT